VNVFLDGAYAFSLPALVAARLRVGQELNEAEVTQLLAGDAEERAYDRALRYLGYRTRSRSELERYLERSGADSSVVVAVMARLERLGLVNDIEFARFWVENREAHSPRSQSALRFELQQKGLDRETINQALEELDPTESAYRAARPKATRLAELAQQDGKAFRRKMSDYLARRGFNYGVIRAVLARLALELASETTSDEVDGEPTAGDWQAPEPQEPGIEELET